MVAPHFPPELAVMNPMALINLKTTVGPGLQCEEGLRRGIQRIVNSNLWKQGALAESSSRLGTSGSVIPRSVVEMTIISGAEEGEHDQVFQLTRPIPKEASSESLNYGQ